MKNSALHWTLAMSLFVSSAVVACAAEPSLDATADEAVNANGNRGTGAPGSNSNTSGGVETTATGLPSRLPVRCPRISG